MSDFDADLALSEIAEDRIVLVKRATKSSPTEDEDEEGGVPGWTVISDDGLTGKAAVGASAAGGSSASVYGGGPILSREQEKTVVEVVVSSFRLKRTWSAEELETRGVPAPAGKFLRRPQLQLRIARHGFAVAFKSRGNMIVATELEGPELLKAVEAQTVASTGTEVFSEADGGSDYFWMPPVSKIVKGAIQNKIPLLLVGPTGSGKTTLLERLLLEHYECDPYVMSLHGEMSADDFFGTKELRQGETVFRPGPALQAMIKKKPLILNELDMAPPEILACLQRPLEKKSVEITQINDERGEPLLLRPWHAEEREVVVRSKKTKKEKRRVTKLVESRFMITATANTTGRGDDTGLYRGAQILNEAFLDRFPVVEFLSYPPEDEEVKILERRTGLDNTISKKIVQLANIARAGLSKEHRLNSTFSIRKTTNMAKLITKIGVSTEEAYIATVLNRVTTEDKIALSEMYQRVFGEVIDSSKIGVTTPSATV